MLFVFGKIMETTQGAAESEELMKNRAQIQ